MADGGKMFINTRKAGEERGIKNKIELESPQEVLVGTPEKITSYQRFFTADELKEYVEKELGPGYKVEKAIIDGQEEFVRFTVRMQKKQNGVHNVFVTDVDIYENLPRNASLPTSNVGARLVNGRVVDTKVENIFEIANNSSKIVDENGEPLVVYHNTDNDFNTFSRSELGRRTTWASNKWGFCSTPSSSYASGYGDKQMSLYVRVTNPKRLSFKEYESIIKEGDEGYGDRVYAEGYDGIIIEVPEAVLNKRHPMHKDYPNGIYEIIVPSANQIKSAEPVTYDDAGNVIPLSERFNPENDDIRFREDDGATSDDTPPCMRW